MKAIVSYSVTTYGCQPNFERSKLVNTQSGVGTKQKIVEFTPSPTLTNEISALKAFMSDHKEYQYGNSVKVIHSLRVESIQS